ncbi:MAG TPA: S-adenosylmethionine:tRNA ribosyltransferase-isomerase [Dehalococcoidia bacterium]|nr:S-adenosylmethionine:tRNA ribosyltransferase-isomerase [Dehalococcoidia bacterium]
MFSLPTLDGYVNEEIRHLETARRRHDPALIHRANQFPTTISPSPALLERGPGGEAAPPISFTLPHELEASGPPERRGLRRDQVRLMLLNRRSGATLHTRFDRIGELLQPGDLLVFNDSRTLPALLPGTFGDGTPIEVRLARQLDANTWDALLLPHGGEHAGKRIAFRAGLHADVSERRPDVPWLWRLRFDAAGAELLDRVYRAGEPVRYTYVPQILPIEDYQTVYAAEPGSVEMPSAGRPFTWELLLALRRRGVQTAFITLHTGLSSVRDDALDALRLGHEEHYRIGPAAAAGVNEARAHGRRVIAVGTTVVRTLETVADAGGRVHAAAGTTGLYISAAHKLRAVDGLLTGLHEPRASHLDLLSAFVSPALLGPAYRQALAAGYLWHEFGDVNLIV